MRETKFRFFSNQTDKYVSDPEDYAVTGDGKIYCITDLSTYREFRELSDCICKEQYTGLKDKNGVEIYEGDIVIKSGYGVYKKVVKWSDDGYMLPKTGQYRYGQVSCELKFEYEVIGNIHQNPELIKAP